MEFAARLRTLYQGWPVREFTWDSRFEAVSCAFSADKTDEARALVLAILPSEWTVQNLSEATAHVRELAKQSGGLRDGQRIFSSTLDGMTAFALWWPWQGGKTISIRIGVDGPRVTPADHQMLREAVAITR